MHAVEFVHGQVDHYPEWISRFSAHLAVDGNGQTGLAKLEVDESCAVRPGMHPQDLDEKGPHRGVALVGRPKHHTG